MKKTLVALAALAATAAFAQSTVTMYGVVDIATGTKDIKGNTGVVSSGKQTGIMDGGFAGNRIGFRGTEDIGGGQSVSFVVEQGMSPTNGALFGVRTANAGFQLDGLAASTGRFDQGTGGGYSQGTNRQTYAGFKSAAMGEVRIGYQYTALYEVSTLMGFTQTSEGVYGGTAAHTHGAGAAGGTRANMINYLSLIHI
jgi:predicted porin